MEFAEWLESDCRMNAGHGIAAARLWKKLAVCIRSIEEVVM